MRQAPPVGVTCSDGGAWRATGALLAALAAGAVVVWGLLHSELGTAVAWASAMAVAAAGGGVAWRLEHRRPVDLLWNGRGWRADGIEGDVDVLLDLGPWMLLRFRPAEGDSRCLPVSRREAGAAWHALRSALYAGPAHPAAER